MYIQTNNSDPDMYILAPLFPEKQKMSNSNQRQEEPSSSKTITSSSSSSSPLLIMSEMMLVCIPFAEDVQTMNMNSLNDAIGNDDAMQVCDDLIDQFMLPPNVLQSESISNPAIQSFHKTVINRAIEPLESDEIIITRKGRNEKGSNNTCATSGKNSINDSIIENNDV